MENTTVIPRRPSRQQRIYDRLCQGIIAGQPGVGERLPAISDLAVRFEASPRTVQLALERLESNGYVTMRHGSGTFVTCRHRPLLLSDTIAVCMETRAHLFGELAAVLANELNNRHMAPLVIDTETEQANALIARISHTDAACLMIHASSETWGALASSTLPANKPVISFLYWDKPREHNFHRILTDFDAGGRMVTRYLHGKGHRRVLLVGTRSSALLYDTPHGRNLFPGASFVKEWRAAGGTWEHIEVPSDPTSTTGYRIDEDRLVACMTAPSAPTAIFGMRDVDAWIAQQALIARLPHLLGKVEFVGYYNTPWSRAGCPPFTTVNLDLPAMAQAAMGLLDDLRTKGEAKDDCIVVQPRLVVR